MTLPMFLAKREVFEWIAKGQKTIDIRKGNLKSGEIAFFQSGPRALRLKIVKTESGRLTKILRLDNYKAVIPLAVQLGDAFDYLRGIYGVCDGVFTAYYVEPIV
jgi:hypothetical protein